MDTVTFDSGDLDVAEDFFSRVYARLSIKSTDPASRTRFHRRTMSSLSVDELDLNFELSYSVSPLRKICLCVVHEGTIRDHVYPGVDDAFGPGDVVSIAPPDLPYSGRICQARYNLVMFDPDLLNQVAAGRSTGPVRLTAHRPHSPAETRTLRSLVGYLRDRVLPNSAVAGRPLVASTALQHLAATVLATFPNTALTDPEGADRADARPATLRRALAFIDDHADQPITVAEIAEAAHVGIRSLQYAFRRYLDTTPLTYLRAVRLAHAHHELITADPTVTTVTQIAARWGFASPGRFAGMYRAAYGRPPSKSLMAG